MKNINLIGISGKAGSGKDLIANIIQYLVCKDELMPHQSSFDEFIKAPYMNEYQSGWKIVKFADKLKDIVCLLTGCTRNDLEDRDFKELELGEEWWYWYMELDGGYSPIILDYLTTTKKELKSYEGLELVKPTPRFLLQFIGTNLLRNQLHPNIWVNTLFADYREKVDFDNNLPMNKNWIITDLRFKNEKKAVEDRGGITIRVNRNALIKDNNGNPIESNKSYYDISTVQHPSETALDDAKFDYYIDNNSDIPSLIEEVKKILIKENIINESL